MFTGLLPYTQVAHLSAECFPENLAALPLYVFRRLLFFLCPWSLTDIQERFTGGVPFGGAVSPFSSYAVTAFRSFSPGNRVGGPDS